MKYTGTWIIIRACVVALLGLDLVHELVLG
jgi:hypothetical protein